MFRLPAGHRADRTPAQIFCCKAEKLQRPACQGFCAFCGKCVVKACIWSQNGASEYRDSQISRKTGGDNMWARWKQNKGIRRILTVAAVTASAFIQAFVIQVFIRPSGLLSGGFTGVAILIDDIASLYGGSFSTSLGMLALNIPVALLCSRSISKRFTFYSLMLS